MTTSTKPAGIDPQTVRQLAEQLASWGNEIITQGRSPFRRIEIFPHLVTAAGNQAPPLVFWINRDSFMAGGVVFLPVADTPAAREAGRRCAEALGLNYFVFWTADGITFWQQSDDTLMAARQIAIGHDKRPKTADFHQALLNLMEEMKTFSVLAAVPPDALSAHYLANLAGTTLADVQPTLTAQCRVRRSIADNIGAQWPDEQQARGKATLTLVRLLALALHDALPDAIQPPDLEEALYLTLEKLPASLASTLHATPNESTLPDEAAVRFHLLLHRLRQLRIARDRPRAAATLQLLLQQQAKFLGSAPLPAMPKQPAEPALLLYADRLPDAPDQQMDVASPALLGLFALLRLAQDRPPALVQASDPLTLPPTPAPRLICGSLIDQRVPAADERGSLSARLRLSWPARRFQLPRNTPLWAWQLLHLLGLADEGARMELVTPAGWLPSECGRQLLPLIYEVATPECVEQQGRMLHWRLVKEDRPEAQVLIQGHGPRLSTSRQRLRADHPVLLALLIELPEELRQLLKDGRLRIPARETWPDAVDKGIFLFTRSSLGRYLWQVAGGGRPLPRQRALQNELCRWGLPLPGHRVLASLQRLTGEESVPVGQGELDRELALWLDLPQTLPAVAGSVCETDDTEPEQSGPDNLDETIADQVFVDGIPLFPEHYLYDYYRPELIEHAVAGPLQIDGEFFDTVTLRTADNRMLQVEGRETARALVLISSVRSGPVALPADRRITAVIFERYLDDLRCLRHKLIREVFQHQSDAQAAEALMEKLWEKQKLPPWCLVSGV